MNTKTLLSCAAAALLSTPLLAKLPAPSDEAKAKAAEATAKAAHNDKIGAYQLCQSQDRVAAQYRAAAKAASREVKPAAEAPACADPGAFVYVPAPPAAAASAAVAAPAAAPAAVSAKK
jgi:hypothetical protein